MAINWKVTMFFGMDKWGWTETYYLFGPSSSFSTAAGQAETLGAARKGLLAKQVVLEGIRISDVDEPNTSIFLSEQDIGGANTDKDVESPWAALLVRVGADDNTYRRSILMRGLPAEWVQWKATSVIAGAWPPSMSLPWNNFLATLITIDAGFQWSIWARNKGSSASPKISVGTIVIMGDPYAGYYNITPVTATTFTVGQRFHFGGARGVGAKGFNGDGIILNKPGANNYVISRRPVCPVLGGVPLFSTVPYMQLIVKGMKGIDSAVRERIVKRDTGRAFFGTAGRQSAGTC